MISEMSWYSIDFLGKLGAWLVESPVVLTFVTLGVLSSLAGVVKRLVSA